MLRYFLSTVFAVTALSTLAIAEDPKPAEPNKATESRVELPAAAKDAAFEAHLDLNALGAAWSAGDADTLAALATKLSDGERALGKPHPKLSADKLHTEAIRAAIASKNVKALDQILAAAEKAKHSERIAAAKAAKQLIRATRATEPALTPNDKRTDETNIQLHLYSDAISNAKRTGDSETLAELEKSIADNPYLKGDTATAMHKAIAAARTEIPADDAGADLLRQLAANSRGGDVAMPGVLAIDFSGTSPVFPPASKMASSAGTTANPIGVGQLAIDVAPKATPAAKKVTVNYNVLNRVTKYNVAYAVVSPGNKALVAYLKPNSYTNCSCTFAAGAGTPMIRIYQVGGKPAKDFTVANGGKYAFQIKPSTGLIENFFR